MTSPSKNDVDWHELARAKLTKVFGDAKGKALFERTLAAAGLERIDSAADIDAVADALEHVGPMEKAAAAMLRMAATLQVTRRHK